MILLKKIFFEDIISIFSAKLKSIDGFYKKIFIINFIFMNVIFGIHTFHFFWGHHDFKNFGILLKSSVFKGTQQGKYFEFLMSNVFLDGYYLPVLTNVLCFIFFSLVAVLLCNYWKLNRCLHVNILFAIVLTSTPFSLVWLFYASYGLDRFCAMFLVVLALMLSEKKQNIFINNVLPIIFFNIALATYPVLINTIFVVYFCKIFILFYELDHDFYNNLKKVVLNQKNQFFNIIVGVFSYKLVLIFLLRIGMFREGYNSQILSCNMIVPRFFKCCKEAFWSLVNYDVSFLPKKLTHLYLYLIMLVVISLLIKSNKFLNLKENILHKFFCFVALFLAIISTQSSMMIAKTEFFMAPRLDLHGLNFFRAFIVAISLQTFPFLKNISLIVVFLIIRLLLINDLLALRTWKLGYDAECMLWNRMMTRLDENPNFDKEKKYVSISIGSVSLRRKFYSNKISKEWEMTHSFNILSMLSLNIFYPQSFMKSYTDDFGNDGHYKKVLKRFYDAGLLQKGEVWPSKNSIIIYNDMILFIMDQKKLDSYITFFESQKSDI